MRKKYFITALLMIFTSLTLFFLLTSLVVTNVNEKNTKNEMQNYLQIVLNEYDGTNMQETANILHNVSKDIRVTFISKDGTVLYDTVKVSEENHLDRLEIKNIGSISYRYSDTLKIKMVYIAGFIKDVYIRVAMPENSTTEIVNSLIIFGIISLLVITIISFFIIQKLSKSFVKPLKEEIKKLSSIVGNESNYVGDDLMVLSSQIDEVRKLIDEKIHSLSEGKAKLNYIIQNMHQGLIILNGAGETILVNETACNILERKSTMALDKPYDYLFASEIITSKINDAMNNIIEDSLSYPIGDRYYILNISSLASEFARLNHKNGVAIFIIDVTNDLALQKTKSDFFANASHELKSPLTSIIGYQQMIKEGIITDEEEIMDATNKTIKEATRMNKIIIEMLELAKLESKTQKEVSNQSILNNIKDVVSSLQSSIDEKNIKVTISDNDFMVKLNNDDLYQLFKNLIENAVKYNKQNGMVKIIINPNQKEVTIEDTGIGIPKSHQGRVFERFYRVDKARSKELGGTGLGLAIVKHICNNYQIKIYLESVEGVKTKFTLSFK